MTFAELKPGMFFKCNETGNVYLRTYDYYDVWGTMACVGVAGISKGCLRYDSEMANDGYTQVEFSEVYELKI